MIFLFQVILLYLQFANCEWLQLGQYLTAVRTFSSLDTDGFIQMNGDISISSQYISCGQNGSYIVLNQTQSNVQNNIIFYWGYQMYFVTFELIFYNAWATNDYVNYSFGSNTFSFDNNSISLPKYYNWQCTNKQSFQQVLNATVNTTQVSGYHSFNISTSQGSLAIKNLIITGLRCHPYCRTCSGVSADECLQCAIEGKTPPNCQQYECPIETPYLIRNQGCFKQCLIDYILYFKGSCVPYPITYFMNLYISQNKTSLQYRWQPIQDGENPGAELLNNTAFENYYFYGIFQHKQGYLSTLNLLANQGIYLIGIRIELILFNAMPVNSSISLQINETYKAHIYNIGSGEKFDQFIVQYQVSKPNFTYSGINYNSNKYYTLYTYVNVSNNFIIKLVGNYPASSSAGWGIRSIQISSGQCPQYCEKCDSQFKCSTCSLNFLISKSGICSRCLENYQKIINATHCLELDDQTPYSEYLVKEFTDLSINPETYKHYELLQSQGSNFFKGEGIFYSIWNQKYRMFGGPQIWAQAKFQRKYEINTPHHSVTFAFIIIFGPSFPEDGSFIFYLENQIQFEITSTSQEITFEYLYLHTANTLNVQWECKGPNNEPFNAYCGFYKYYLAVHYCQPECQQCTNASDCIPAKTFEACSNGQYLDIYKNKCKQCSKNCKRCTSLQNCQECLDGYIDPSLGCICGIKKFEDSNGCSDCSQDCNQCINQTFCLECRHDSLKVLINNECVCQDGYFDNSTACAQCQANCKRCTNSSDCSECFEGFQITNSVQCAIVSNNYYSTLLKQSFPCPTTDVCNPCSSSMSNCSCGDKIIGPNEYCDDGNSEQYDGCHNCQFSVQIQCTMQINGKCRECATQGWYLDQTTSTCKEQCRDGLKVGKEKCDDGLDNSNCLNCDFFCRNDCQMCDMNQGVCTKCRVGLKQEKNYCINICGDGIIVSAPDIDYYEECDDSNNQDDDGCSKLCKFQCQNDKVCQMCVNELCQQCQHGYFLNKIMNKCECGLSCLTCDYSSGKGCSNCQHGYELRNKICYPICGDSYVTFHEQCDDGNLNIDDGCHQCQYTCEQTCELCLFGECLSCYENYQLQNERCTLIILPYSSETDIEKGTLSHEEQLNPMKDQYFDVDLFENRIQNNNMKYISYLDSLYLFHRIRVEIQGIEVTENYIEKYEQTCPINCLSCFRGVCITCTLGYHLNLDNNTCNPVCGDQLIAIEELCDDGDNIIYDGCFNCKYQCQEECTNCQYGKCKACIESYFFDIKKGRCLERTICIESQGYYYDDKQNICYSKCGDSIKAGKEQCDDGNDAPYDGCYQCQYQCELLCQTCQQGRCVDCQIGYKLSIDKCVADCGDGLILGSEQCDDANAIPRDGCTNCLIDPGFNCITLDKKSYCYTCKSNCSKCEYINGQINCLNCQKGFFLASNECIKCSDQCEECLSSPNNCTNCKIENCQKCDNKEGFYSDFKLKKCITKCGDMIVAGQEQCDDGNIINNDGCNSQCEFEKGFTCYNNLCQKIQQKTIEFNYSNNTTTNCLHLKGDIDFKSICPKITSEIDLFATHEFNYTLTPFEINQTQIQYGCEILFQFFKTITETNLIHLIIPLSVDGQRLLDEYRITIIPRKQIYYSQEQKQQAESVVATSNKFQLLLQCTGPLSILLGGISFFWTILEILTWINNFYFLNIEYPLNVKIFFQKFQWDDIFYIPDFVSLNTPNDPFYFQPPLKFQEKNVNPLFINNIQIFTCLISIAIEVLYFYFLYYQFLLLFIQLPISQSISYLLLLLKFSNSSQIPINLRVIRYIFSRSVNQTTKSLILHKISKVKHSIKTQKSFLILLY